MACMIKYARPDALPRLWEQVAKALEPAIVLSRGRFTQEDVKALILEGKYHLLVAEDETGKVVAALTAAVIGYPKCRSLEVSFLGGSRGFDWGGAMLAAVENMAKITGCSAVEFRGRKEWGNVLKHDGYEAVSTLYEKVISPCVTSAPGATPPAISSSP